MALRILTVTAEAFPLAKTGGLGDAVSGMARALAKAGVEITVMLPAYPGVLDRLTSIKELTRLTGVAGGDARLFKGWSEEIGVPVLVVQNDALYDRDNLYVDGSGQEYSDNAVRFSLLARAAAHVAAGAAGVAPPHVVHAHDWHAALTPLYMLQAGIRDVKSVLTVHNLAFQGVYDMSLAEPLGIEPRHAGSDGMEFWGKINFMKAGIRYADRITVVSRNYGREILTPEFGCGLEGVLRARRDALVAVPNGIDTAHWNPANDPYLGEHTFSASDMTNKTACKLALQERFGLHQDPDATLLAMGSRLTTQKMADLAAQALPQSLARYPHLQIALIGRGDKQLEDGLIEAAARFPGRFGVHIGFDEPSAHLLHAGADILLHGSRFEPFGLTPLYAMRYGTLPIGSRVGGMVDTIADAGSRAGASAMRGATGFLFEGDTVPAMQAAIARAVDLRQHPGVWRAMQHNGMTADFSWERCAPGYTQLYRSLAPSSLAILEPRTEVRAVPAARQPALAPASIAEQAARVAARRKRAARNAGGGMHPGAVAA